MTNLLITVGQSHPESDPEPEPEYESEPEPEREPKPELESELLATWTDDAPDTKSALEAALPVEGQASRWGEELYFDVPVDVPAENARAVVDVGTIAYWPTGNALCLFWGPTPASDGSEPRAASPVNVVAQVEDVSPLETLDPASGTTVRIERVDENRST